MRFLWLTKDLPMKADTGAHLYSNGLLRALVATGASGTLITYSSAASATPIPNLNVMLVPHPRRFRALSLLSGMQSDAYVLSGASFARLVRDQMAESPDCIFLDYFAMGWLLPVIEAAQKDKARPALIVYVSHNYETAVRRQVARSMRSFFFRQVLKLDAEKAAKLDLKLARSADLIVANTDEDRFAYEKDVPEKKVITVSPAYDGIIAPTRAIMEVTSRRVIIVGSFEWIAKSSSLKRFLSAAEEPFRRAGITVLVVGKVPNNLIKERFSKKDFCTFTGWVEDVRPYISDARIGVVPDDVGGGFKHKLLYYIFAGLPVAAIRSQVAGLPVDVENDLITAHSADDLVRKIVITIDDLAGLNGMRTRCWDQCAARYSWTERGKRLRGAIDPMLKLRLADRESRTPNAEHFSLGAGLS